MMTNATPKALSPKRGWTPIAWIDAGIRVIALVILVTAGLLNAQPEDSPGRAHLERARTHLQHARSALAPPHGTSAAGVPRD